MITIQRYVHVLGEITHEDGKIECTIQTIDEGESEDAEVPFL
jgi:hypothetical protein